MALSAFDLFTIGVGPSSSHTVGPMRAARRFGRELRDGGLLARVSSVTVDLYGSLAATGRGHGTPGAVLLGLAGHSARRMDPRAGALEAERIEASGGRLRLLAHDGADGPEIVAEVLFHPRRTLARHANALRLTARDCGGDPLAERVYYSVGGGFVVAEGEAPPPEEPVEHPFATGADLLRLTAGTGLSISELVAENELSRRSPEQVRAGLLEIWHAMDACIAAGLEAEGVLPGPLGVRRRAAGLARSLRKEGADPLEWATVYAMAVNEENAAGMRVVTAPTNGAAGVVPAVLRYAVDTLGAGDEEIRRFLLTAAAIGMLVKRNASISGAEVGCQGEVGAACAMAAAGLADLLGGTPGQIENAAEIGIEHNLGLTCDPIAGLVQIPCIERNGVAATKAVTAARIAVRGDGTHRVTLDQALATLRSTGADMHAAYKETSLAGLAVNVPEC